MGIRRGEITTKIVSDGLVFNMDPANRASYPKTGTTATDTIGNNSCTLNGTTFSNVNSGIFNFDGSDDFVSISGGVSSLNFGTDDLTYSVWVKASFSSSNRYFMGTFTDPTTNNGGIAMGVHTSQYPSWRVWFSGTYFNPGTAAIVDGEWHNFILIRNSGTAQVYIDGVADGSGVDMSTKSITNSAAIQVGRLMNGLEYWNGDIGPVHIYNRALSAEEVLSNYNGLKERFEL
jgi:hypothetical protein